MMCPIRNCGQVISEGALSVSVVAVVPTVPLVDETDNQAASLAVEKLDEPELIEMLNVLLAGVVPAIAAKDKLVGAKISVGPAPLNATINSAKASEPLAVAVAVGTPVAATMLSSEKAVSLLGEFVVSASP